MMIQNRKVLLQDTGDMPLNNDMVFPQLIRNLKGSIKSHPPLLQSTVQSRPLQVEALHDRHFLSKCSKADHLRTFRAILEFFQCANGRATLSTLGSKFRMDPKQYRPRYKAGPSFGILSWVRLLVGTAEGEARTRWLAPPEDTLSYGLERG
ncbi:hypothetical protein GQ53DRAFT_361259 [Thozetella sp. PMI_491]|nr:hypothetical protein GQ53DRAFT_361259 [Thozetella sp. PMI_491]